MLKYNVLKALLGKFNITKDSVISRLEEIGQRESALNLKNWDEVDSICKAEINKMVGPPPSPQGFSALPEEVFKEELPPKRKRRTREEIDKQKAHQKKQMAIHYRHKGEARKGAPNIQKLLASLWDKDKQKIKDPQTVVEENVKQLKLPL